MAHPTHTSMKARGHRDHSDKVKRFTSDHTSEAEIKRVVKPEIKSAMAEHERHERAEFGKGDHTRLHLARGGAAKKPKGGNHVRINIVHPGAAGGLPGAPPGPAMRPPIPSAAPTVPPPAMGPGGPPGAMPPRPPMGGGMPMARPPGASPMMVRKAGGRVNKARGGGIFPHAGGKSGVARLEKAAHEKGRHKSEGPEKPQVENWEGVAAVKKKGGKVY